MANIGGREPYLPVKVTWNLCWITRNVKNILLYKVPSTKYKDPLEVRDETQEPRRMLLLISKKFLVVE